METQRTVLPNFLIIGAAKSGTTAIWHFIRQHPEIYMSPHKEPRYFAVCDGADFRGPGDQSKFRLTTDWNDYKQHFTGVNGERAIGEASPWYLYVDSAPPAIKKRLPDVKLVAILRDPAERAFSNYLHSCNEDIEPAPTFYEAIEREEERISANWSPRFHYVQKGFYYKQLQRYLEYFERDQLRIYLFQDFKADSDSLFSDLFDYLGVSQTFDVDTRERVNDSRKPRSEFLHQLLDTGNPIREAARKIVPPSWRKTIRLKLNNLNRKEKPKLKRSDRKYLIDVYRDDILQLQSFLGRDLSSWLKV